MDGENINIESNVKNGNKRLLWLIAIVNILTLILLIGFIAMSWNVITTEKISQQETEQQTSTSTQQQTPPQTQQQQPPTGGQIQPPTGGQTQPPTNGGTTQGKCGDGICDDIEKQKGVCPQDCK